MSFLLLTALMLFLGERFGSARRDGQDLTVKDGTKAGESFLATHASSAQADAVLATAEETVKALEAEAAKVRIDDLETWRDNPPWISFP